MTEHKATPEQWAADRYDWARADTEALDGNSAFRCIMELRSRVEALEATQRPNMRPTTKNELQNLPEGTRLLSYKVENSALPVGEWGKGHTIVDSAKPAESNYPEKPDSSLVDQISGVIAETFAPYVTADKPARAAILAVADWFDQKGLHSFAKLLRQEVG